VAPSASHCFAIAASSQGNRQSVCRFRLQIALEIAAMTMRTIAELTRWTPIAVQIDTISGLRWAKLDGAPITLSEAKEMHGAGRLLKALRRDGDATYVVVKLPRSKAAA
jgi:hypothetical protein